MVAKTKTKGEKLETGRTKVGKLNFKKETVKDLPGSQQKKIKGGQFTQQLACTRNASGCI